MNKAQKALLARLQEIAAETPESGALNAGGYAYHPIRFSRAIEARADDGPALVAYARSKVHEPATPGYNALIKAKRPDLTVEDVVSKSAAPWASEFTDEDRAAAKARLGAMIEADLQDQAAAEAKAVEHDRKIVSDVNARRVSQGKSPLMPEQEQDILDRRAAERAAQNYGGSLWRVGANRLDL